MSDNSGMTNVEARSMNDMHEIRPGQSLELLKELHILTRDGKMNQDSRRKLKQVYHLYQFIEPLLKEIQQDHADIQLVDHGAGKSYLGFILYDLFFKTLNNASHIYGIETRDELVTKSCELAAKLNFPGMSFLNLSVAESILSDRLPAKIDVVTALRAAFIDASLRLRTDAAGRSADWYVDQAGKAQVALATAESRKSEFERTNGIVMAPGGADSETMKLEQMQSALLTARSSMGMSRGMIGPSPAVESLKSQINSADDAMVQASQRLGTSHPTYIGLVEQRKVLVQQLARETAAAQASAGANAGSDAGASISRLASELDAQKVKVLALKSKLDELAQLQREVDLRKGQYESAAQRAANLKLEANVSETELVSLGEAFVSGKPSFPNKPLILGLGFFAGLAIGVFAAIVTELLSRRVRAPEDLAQAANAAVLAVIAATAPVATQRRFMTFGRRRDVIALQAAE